LEGAGERLLHSEHDAVAAPPEDVADAHAVVGGPERTLREEHHGPRTAVPLHGGRRLPVRSGGEGACSPGPTQNEPHFERALTRGGAAVELRGAVCLVTGASSGIGRATALRLSHAGARVVPLGRARPALDEVAARTGGSAIVADLADPAEVERAAAESLTVAGRVDVLVN